MADFESIIKNHVNDEGNIPSSAINAIVTAIKTAVGNEFVDKERYKAKLTEIDTLKEQQQTAEDNATTANKWKTKYEALKEDFDTYKTEQAQKETHSAKTNVYRELLKEAGVSEKRIEAILKVSDIDGIELGEDGKAKDADKLTKSIKTEWADFIPTVTETGADTATPPTSTQGKIYTREDIKNMTPAEINKNFDAIKASLKGEK